LKDIENTLLNKGSFKFIKQDWISRANVKSFLSRNNVIYYLIDTKDKLLYIGEGEHSKRIFQPRKEISNWDYFRVDCLPEWLTKSQRVELERLVIRSFASILHNKRNVLSKTISTYTLVNRKIDR
ncbi:MAG: GIY-YIG nuclease family protein, partial [Bacteroidota bacterium]